MQKIDQKIVWAIVIAVVVIIAIVVAVKMTNNSGNTDKNNTKQPLTQEQATTTAPENTTAGAGNLSYNNALKKYGTNRIQFDAVCQAHPNNVTYKAGTQVMFDNRSAVARAINFNGHIYNIAADGFAIITMTAAKYPATVLVDCGKSQNVATVLIQK